MKKEVYGIMTEVPIMLKTITINRRHRRMRNAEIWMIDGVDMDDKVLGCIGFVTVIYREEPEDHYVCGSIKDIYDSEIDERKMLWDILYPQLSTNLAIEDADCFFTWRSGTVDQGWHKPRMCNPEDPDDPDANPYQYSEQSDVQTPFPAPGSPSESREA